MRLYNKLFASRAALSFFVMMILFLVCVLRVAVITLSENYIQIQSEQASLKINISRLRGTIYDCNMVPLTNSTLKTIAAVPPTDLSIMTIGTEIKEENLELINELKKDLPIVCEVENEINTSGIVTTKVYTNSEKISACHLIGYTDSTGHGVSGLELAYDELLYSDKFASAVFTTDGKGNVLEGIDPYFENDLSIVHSGVVTTIDVNMQTIVENALTKLNSGCAIVSEVSTGKIRALASVPTYDTNNIVASLNNENSPMINRALEAFNIGSIFKPIIAAAAIENGYMNHTFECSGSTKIIDRNFRCHKITGHGEMDIKNALAQSCNCYFYDIAIMLGKEKVYNYMSSISLGNKIFIANNLYSKAGKTTSIDSLTNDASIANLSIGQGDLLASPVAMLNLYSAIANGGSYILPSVVEKTIKDGAESRVDISYPTFVMNSQTAYVLREYLKTVITEGTGQEAKTQNCIAAGKTATAQTGRYYDDGTEITNSWFCGFFPADAPQYVVVVMSDSKSNVSTASIFAQIADEITVLYG